MTSTENWWTGAMDWTTPAGILLRRFVASLPHDRAFHLTLYGSAALQLTVDLFRPEFDESSPNGYPENTRKLWREVFNQDIDVREQIIEPAVAKRKMGFGEIPPPITRRH